MVSFILKYLQGVCLRSQCWLLCMTVLTANTGLAQHSAEGAPKAPIHLTDDRGTSVRLKRAPQRIVSLLPSLSESICALGACSRLVGVDRYSTYPDFVAHLPRVGGGMDPHTEAIVALQPDVVLLATSSRSAQRLEELGLTVVALEPKTQADVRRVLQQLDILLGDAKHTNADQLWEHIQNELLDIARQLPAHAKAIAPKVFMEVSPGPYAAGPTSFIGETLHLLGLDNIVPATRGAFPKLNPEFVLRADPDLIITSSRGMQANSLYPGWQSMRAIRAGHVCAFNAEDFDIIVRPGPRLAKAAQLIVQCVRDKLP